MQAFRILGLTFLCIAPAVLAAEQTKESAPKPSSEIPDRREFPVNPSINPCTNFYDYACSVAISRFKLRDDRNSHIFSFSDSRERLLAKKKDYLKEIDQKLKAKQPLSERATTLATVYGACVNEASKKQDETSLVKDLKGELTKIKDRKAYFQFLAQKRSEGYPSFIELDNIANQEKPEVVDFLFMLEDMTLPERSYYLNPETVKDYTEVLENFFTTLGESKANAKTKAAAVVKLETEISKIKPLPAEMRQVWTSKTFISKKDALAKFPSFFQESDIASIPDTTLVRNLLPEPFVAIEKLFQTAALEDLKNLYLFKILHEEMDDAYPQFFAKMYAFEVKHLGAPKVRPVREERCTKKVMNTFEKEIDAELLPVVFPDFPQQKFIDLAEKVRASIIEGVKLSNWLTEEGKKGAIEKMTKAKLQLVQPRTEEEWYFNPPATYTLTSSFHNDVALNKVKLARIYDELKKPRNRDMWYMGPLTVNAYYDPTDNKFVMPIGILQYPFYDPKLSVEENLGSVGAVIGHELGHGIDDQGAQFDADGKLKQWLSDADVKAFQERGKKFIAQFDKAGHNGALTLGENIGDLTGVTAAYRAAFPGDKGSKEQKQAFFLQYARVWCSVELPKFSEQMLKVDQHSRGWARTNEQVKNQPGFAEAFSCKKDDPMVLPKDQLIKIW